MTGWTYLLRCIITQMTLRAAVTPGLATYRLPLQANSHSSFPNRQENENNGKENPSFYSRIVIRIARDANPTVGTWELIWPNSVPSIEDLCEIAQCAQLQGNGWSNIYDRQTNIFGNE